MMTSSPRHINYVTYRRSTVSEDEIFGPPTLKFKLVVSARSRRTILVIQEYALIRVPRKTAKCIPLKITVTGIKGSNNCHRQLWGYIDVSDGFWRPNVLLTTARSNIKYQPPISHSGIFFVSII